MNNKNRLYSLIIITIIFISANFIIIIPMNKKLDDLNLQKDEIIIENENREIEFTEENIQNNETENLSIYENNEIIEINSNIEKITEVEYIEKAVSDNGSGNKVTILNIRIKGSEKNIFKVIEYIEKSDIKSKIRSIEIEKINIANNINTENKNNNNEKNSKISSKDNNKKPNNYTCMLKLEIV